MIKKLTLNKFGKFIKKTFDFSPVTLFFGKNEAGKSTILDALALELCSYDFRRGSAASLIKDRYGKDIDKEISFLNSSDFKVPIEDFFNIYAIRYGETSVTMGENWIDKVTSSLMTGGINPKSIYEELAVFSNPSGTYKHNKESKKLKDSIEKLENDIENKENEYKEKISSYTDIESNQKRISILDEDIKDLEEKLSKIESEVKKQDKLKEKAKYQEVKNLLNKHKELLEKLKGKEVFKEDRIDEIKNLETKISEIKNKLIYLKSTLDTRKENKEKLEGKVSELKLKEEVDRRENNLVKSLLEELEKNKSISPKLSFNKWYLLFGGCLMGIIVFLAFYLNNYYLFASIVIGLGVFSKGFKKGKNVNEFINKIKERYKDATSKIIESEDIPSLKAELLFLSKDYDNLLQDFNNKKEELANLHKTIKEEEEIVKTYTNDLNSLNKEKTDLLNTLESKDITDYSIKLKEYNALKENFKDLEENLKKSEKEFNQNSLEDLNNFLITQIETIESKFLDDDKKLDSEIKKDKIKLEELREELNLKKEERTKLDKATESAKSKIEGSLDSYDTNNLRKQKSEKEEELLNLILEIEGSKVAASLFEELSKDSTVMFNKLSEQVSENFGKLLPSAKEISINSIKKEDNILIEDEGGVKRKPENLSTGTKDLFYFALRLVLAKHYNEKIPILLLDEPFHSFDYDRTLKALELLKIFQEKHSCQLIIFSKDKYLVIEINKIFKDNFKLHNL